MRKSTDRPAAEEFDAHWHDGRADRAERLLLALLFILGFGATLLLCSAGAALWMLVRP